MFHRHRYDKGKKEQYITHIEFQYVCIDCGHIKNKVVEVGSGFEFTVE